MKIAFGLRGIVWAAWMKALLREVCPETVNIRKREKSTAPPHASIAVFEIENRVTVVVRSDVE